MKRTACCLGQHRLDGHARHKVARVRQLHDAVAQQRRQDQVPAGALAVDLLQQGVRRAQPVSQRRVAQRSRRVLARCRRVLLQQRRMCHGRNHSLQLEADAQVAQQEAHEVAGLHLAGGDQQALDAGALLLVGLVALGAGDVAKRGEHAANGQRRRLEHNALRGAALLRHDAQVAFFVVQLLHGRLAAPGGLRQRLDDGLLTHAQLHVLVRRCDVAAGQVDRGQQVVGRRRDDAPQRVGQHDVLFQPLGGGAARLKGARQQQERDWLARLGQPHARTAGQQAQWERRGEQQGKRARTFHMPSAAFRGSHRVNSAAAACDFSPTPAAEPTTFFDTAFLALPLAGALTGAAASSPGSDTSPSSPSSSGSTAAAAARALSRPGVPRGGSIGASAASGARVCSAAAASPALRRRLNAWVTTGRSVKASAGATVGSTPAVTGQNRRPTLPDVPWRASRRPPRRRRLSASRERQLRQVAAKQKRPLTRAQWRREGQAETELAAQGPAPASPELSRGVHTYRRTWGVRLCLAVVGGGCSRALGSPPKEGGQFRLFALACVGHSRQPGLGQRAQRLGAARAARGGGAEGEHRQEAGQAAAAVHPHTPPAGSALRADRAARTRSRSWRNTGW